MERHNVRTKRVFSTTADALNAIRDELKDYTRQTTRSFWVDGQKFIARKTNLYGVNLTVTKVKPLDNMA
jgi:hypothetical protein